VSETAINPRYTEAAEGRYRLLRTNVFVTLSEHCTVDHKGRAADAVADLVRPELESSYAVLLESNDLRDKATAEAESLRARLALVAAAMDEIEQRAKREESDGIAAAYCALWDAHGLISDALNARMP
jgi:hypothetical protein